MSEFGTQRVSEVIMKIIVCYMLYVFVLTGLMGSYELVALVRVYTCKYI